MNFAAMQEVLKNRFAKWYPFGGEIEADGFKTVYSSIPIHQSKTD